VGPGGEGSLAPVDFGLADFKAPSNGLAMLAICLSIGIDQGIVSQVFPGAGDLPDLVVGWLSLSGRVVRFVAKVGDRQVTGSPR
jgi:hypothetical protein